MLLLAYFVFGHYACAIAGTDGTIRRLNAAGALMLVASLVLFVAAPGLGQDMGDYQGALRGVFVQKNLTAWAFQLALACLGYRFYLERRIGAGFVVRAVVIVGAIVLTRSTTQLLGCAALLGFWAWSGWFRASRLKALPVWVATCALVIAGWTLWGLGDEAYRVLGKDPTLTGREAIWELAERAIAARPWFGWGFQGFWQPDERAVQEIWAVTGWIAPHAHNGLLELLLETGFVGAALFALLVGHLVVLVARGLARDEALAWWTASWMMLVALKAHAEPVYLQLDLSTALLSFSTVALGMRERERSLQTRAARASATAWRAGPVASAS
jgi:O-antigen ligase